METCVNCQQSAATIDTEHGPICTECYHALVSAGLMPDDGALYDSEDDDYDGDIDDLELPNY